MRRGGLEVQTTIDPDLQEVGLEAMRSALPYSTDPSSALVSIDPRNGHIRAMVSSSNYAETQFNLAAQGRRQPGSTFKAFVLTTAIKQGIDPYSTYYTSKPLDLDLPHWGHWSVATADEGYQGTVNLQQATVTSDNTVFAQLDLDVGPKSVAQTAKSMGITTPAGRDPGRGDRRPAPRRHPAGADRRLRDPRLRRHPPRPGRDREGDLPRRQGRPAAGGGRRSGCCPKPVAYEVTKLLHDNITEGTGTAAYTGCAGQAGKTGTTDEYTDAWFSGYQPNLATAVWVGYPESNDVSMYQRPRDHRLRRHLPGRNLALALLQRRRPLRGIRANRRSRSAGRPTTATSPRRAPATRLRQRRRRRRQRSRRRPAAPRSAATTRANTTRRLRPRRRPGTGAAAAPATPGGGGGGDAAAASG